jgi:molecular chaperone GrpE
METFREVCCTENNEIGAEKLAPPEQKGQDQLGDPESRVNELQERLLRLQADFENYKKRTVRENEMLRESASAEMMLKILPIVDEFEIAISHMDHASAKDFKQGMEMIYAKLNDLLRKEGVEEMKALGESFDPYKHDALRQGDGEEGKITEVVLKGYYFKGKVLRHAKVVVGKGKGGN